MNNIELNKTLMRIYEKEEKSINSLKQMMGHMNFSPKEPSRVLIRYNALFETEMEEEKLYYVFFDKPKSEIIFPGPMYVTRPKPFNDTVEYYSELLCSVDKEVIPMIYKGKSRIDDKRMFEINIISIIRERKINSILGE